MPKSFQKGGGGSGGSGGGNVTGAASSTDNAIARFDGTTGKVIQDYTSGAPTISDTGVVTLQKQLVTKSSNGTAAGDISIIGDDSLLFPKGIQFDGTNATINFFYGGARYGAFAGGGEGWKLISTLQFSWSSSSSDVVTSADTGLARSAAGIVKITDGSSGAGDLTVADQVYGVEWNGSLEVPTKNAVYDKIETLPNISSGAGVPASTPSKIGDIFIDTTNDDAYIAVGTASSADWEKTNDGGGGGSVDISGTPTAGQVVRWVDADTIEGVTALGISDLSSKTTPVDADETVIRDSADSGNGKKLSWSNIKATLKTYFDTLYRSVSTSIGTTDLDNDAVTYAKIQNVSATDRLLGRSTSGAGDVEEITCTAAGRAILDDADAAAQRATLGLTIGTNVQAYDADLSTIAGLTATTDNFMQSKSSAWASRTPAQVAADLVGAGLDVDMLGFRGIPQNSQSAAYTCVAADGGKHIFHPTADDNARTFTIPSNASVAFEVGTAITFVNQINTVTIAITSDTLRWAKDGSTGSRTLAANGIATAIKITSTEWLITGEGLT